MGFFDLNIPYETSQSSKTTRIKVVIKAMELGYTGIAYNRTIKGVMSDHDRCSIMPLSLSSLLNVAPSLASSVNLHRDLLGIPRSSPFRQYTRLTVSVDTPAQCQALNSGNPILKTYDLVAVRPLNQSAFDHACEKSEVDIIAIDFSEKLPFRLKLPMVKAAMERGVHFEISYSDLILDVQVRRQMISNAKLLVDWTRGRNLIFSSAAPSVNELRGPYDAANLSSLLGLSIERAKAAISKNCRNLVANALRKKHFYKGAIRVELISSDEKSGSKEPLSMDWLKWDPISSGEGDLQLEDMAKSFSATISVSNSVKAIDFASLIGSMPPHGEKFLTAKAVELPVAATGVSENLLPETDWNSFFNSPSKNQTFDHGSSRELCFPNNAAKNSTNFDEIGTPTNAIEEGPKDSNGKDALLPLIVTQKPDLQSQKHIPSCELNAMELNEDIMHQLSAAEVELTDSCVHDNKRIETLSENVNFLAPQIKKCMNSQGSDAFLDSQVSDAFLDAQNVVMDTDMAEMGVKDQEDTPVIENISGREYCKESDDDTMTLGDHVRFPLVCGDIKIKEAPSVANQENLEEVAMEEREAMEIPEVAMEEQEVMETLEGVAMEEQVLGDVDTENVLGRDNDLKAKDTSSGAHFMPLEEEAMKEQKLEETDAESNHPMFFPSSSGKSRAKQRLLQQPLVFPLKRLLNPIPFKKKSKKFKHKMNV
ncbi:hypothetical protein P3X46_000283 [Hevea brasiliensis]|uniref:RNase P subunit p30 family protein n=1 Tax=Hevea brasiliensis TaxID=3981 RepID=A0ABQ9NBX5_HEVBR|nr:uncharacterized protein LOC110665362 [Hevea brasiliensis]KAJ9188933.1 hypothetical protein P3X46_000283 [Hevea brasiliensis]